MGSLLPSEDGDGPVYQDWLDEGLDPRHQAALTDATLPSVCHTTFDWVQLGRQGFVVAGPLYDTRTMAATLNENQDLDLKVLAKKYTGTVLDKETRKHLDTLPHDEVLAYNRRDLYATQALYRKLRTALRETAWEAYWLQEEVPFTRVLVDMMLAGLPVDLDAADELSARLEDQAGTMLAKLYADARLPADVVNLGSGDQLAAYLFSKRFFVSGRVPITPEQRAFLKSESIGPGETDDIFPRHFGPDKIGRLYVHGSWNFPGRGLKKGAKSPSKNRPSTSTPALMQNLSTASDPWVRDLLAWRKVNKVLTTYLHPMPEYTQNGRMYGTFTQAGTVTGRLSSSEPNLQNIPARGPLGTAMRSLFVGDLVVADFSQLEPRLMAHFSKDPAMMQVFGNPDGDIYLDMAERVAGQRITKDDPLRQVMKTFILAFGYGAGVKKLVATVVGGGYDMTIAEGEEIYRELERAYAAFFEWKRAVIASAHAKGYVTTLSGRYRRLAARLGDWHWKNVGYGERQAVNAIIQGSAADVARRTMMVIAREVPEVRQLAQVHDEVIMEWRGYREWKLGTHPMERIQAAGESGHGFELNVPLVFVPYRVNSWADKA